MALFRLDAERCDQVMAHRFDIRAGLFQLRVEVQAGFQRPGPRGHRERVHIPGQTRLAKLTKYPCNRGPFRYAVAALAFEKTGTNISAQIAPLRILAQPFPLRPAHADANHDRVLGRLSDGNRFRGWTELLTEMPALYIEQGAHGSSSSRARLVCLSCSSQSAS